MLSYLPSGRPGDADQQLADVDHAVGRTSHAPGAGAVCSGMARQRRRRTSCLLLAAIALNGCGANWRPVPAAETRIIKPRRCWSFTLRISLSASHGVGFGRDSVSGIPWLEHLSCDSCRVHYALADMSQARTGEPGRPRGALCCRWSAIVRRYWRCCMRSYAADSERRAREGGWAETGVKSFVSMGNYCTTARNRCRLASDGNPIVCRCPNEPPTCITTSPDAGEICGATTMSAAVATTRDDTVLSEIA